LGRFDADSLRRNARISEVRDRQQNEGMPDEQAEEEIKKIQAETDTLRNLLEPLKESFSGLFTDLVTGAKSVGDAFRDMARSIVNSLLQMVNQILAQKLFEMLLGAIGGRKKKGSSYIDEIFNVGNVSGFASNTTIAPGGFDIESAVSLAEDAAAGFGDERQGLGLPLVDGAIGSSLFHAANVFTPRKQQGFDILGTLLGAAANIFGGGGFSGGGSIDVGSLLGLAGSGFSGISNSPLELLDSASGSYPFKAFATGGVVTQPTLGLIGEGKFDEAVVPLPNGRSIPVDFGGAAIGGGGNNVAVNVTVNNAGGAQTVTNGEANEFSRRIESAVVGVLIKERRPGGILYR